MRQSLMVKNILSESRFEELLSNQQHDKVNKNLDSTHIPRVIAVSGGKGGVGKSLTTANVGLCFARMGMRTLLIDGDLGLANLDVLLNVNPKFTLDDVLAGERMLNEIIVTGLEGLCLLPSKSGMRKVPELGHIQKLMLLDQIELLDDEFDIVLIDTPAGISADVQYWIASASEAIIVTTPDPTAIADAYATVKVLHGSACETRFKLVVNMVRSAEEAADVFERLNQCTEEYLGVTFDYLGFVPSDDAVRNSLRQRDICVRKYPLSLASAGWRSVADQLIHCSNKTGSKGTIQFFWKRMVAADNRSYLL